MLLRDHYMYEKFINANKCVSRTLIGHTGGALPWGGAAAP